MSTEVGRVTRLSVTPVKGFALHHPEAVDIDASGAVGDRDLFLVDDRDRLLSITRTGAFAAWTAEVIGSTLVVSHPDGRRLEADTPGGRPVVATFYGSHGVPGRVVEGPWAGWLSEIAGRPVRLVRASQPGEGSDEHPVTLLADASVAALAGRLPGRQLDARRFRMLIGFSGSPPFAEEGWRGRPLRVGDVELRVGGPVPRCAATTRDPDTGVSDLRTLHLIEQARGRRPNEFGDGLNLGSYAQVASPGRVRVGDPLRLG